MARHVFNMQIKRTFLYSECMINLLLFLSFIIAWYLMLYPKTSTYVMLPFFGLVLYNIFLYKPMLRDWNMFGPSRIVIDTDKKEVVIDKNTRLPFDCIERVRIELEERPRICWFLTLGKQYSDLVNGEVFFKHNEDYSTVVAIQLRDEVDRLMSVIHSQGIPCRIQGEDFLDEKIPRGIWYAMVLFLLLGLGVIWFIKFYNDFVNTY
ncbi:hypothetical protein J6A31_01450 [bacterium]|nr:hypothetical protein [bacterium]